jgi:peptide/nickel transport system substrate-binding protein
MGYSWIGMNVLDPALSNVTLRTAIRDAIDVPSINLATSEGEDVIPVGLVAPSAPLGFWTDAPHHEQNMAEAQQLVQQVPEADRNIRITVADDETSRTVAQIAAENLEEAGLTVDVEILDAATFFVTGPENRSRQLFFTGYGVPTYADPSQELQWFTCSQVDVWNYMNWCSEDYDRLFAEATATLDTDSRSQKYVEMQQLWDEAIHTVWVAHGALVFASRNDVVTPSISPSGTVFYQSASPAG